MQYQSMPTDMVTICQKTCLNPTDCIHSLFLGSQRFVEWNKYDRNMYLKRHLPSQWSDIYTTCIADHSSRNWISVLTTLPGLRIHRECGERLPRHQLQRKPVISDPGMHHDTCVTQLPWCISVSLTRSGGENVPVIAGACASCNIKYVARGPFHKPPMGPISGVQPIWWMLQQNLVDLPQTITEK